MTEERPWLKNYPKGVPANIDANAFSSLNEFFDATFEQYKKLPAYSVMGKELSYEQIDKLSRNFGAYLVSRGLEPGDRIALMMPNLLQYPIALFGALRAGLIVVNTNPLYTSREMHHQFTDSGAKAIVIAENFAHNLEKIVHDTGIKTVIVTSIGELLGFFKGRIVNVVVRTVKRAVPKYNLPNHVKFSEALKHGKKFTLEIHKGQQDDTVILQYTGGTTGTAKGAMLTNKNLIANMLQIRALLDPNIKEGEEIALSPLPMYHIFAFTVNCMALMSRGILNVMIVNPKDLSTIVSAFKKYKITIMTGVNTLFNVLLNYPKFTELDLSALRISVGGGMAVQRAVAENWRNVVGSHLTEGYGMTEASPVVSVNPVDGSGRLGTIGFPLPSTDVRIVGEDGTIQALGEVGELEVQGPQVMKGYYNKPSESEACLHDGWLRTGDLGVMLEGGYFKIVDRKKDMILVSGFNVFPNEVEDVIASHPKVLEVAAIGVADEKSGEVVKVFVVKKDKSLKEKELIAFCRENMTGYKVPKYVEWRKELPKTNVGKILRRALREEKT